jgi:signal transduction histidine kinase
MSAIKLNLRLQLAILVGIAFLTGQILIALLFYDERSLAVQAAIGVETAARAANAAKLMATAPQELRQEIAKAASSPLVRFGLGNEPIVLDGVHHNDQAIQARIRAFLGDNFKGEIRVEVHELARNVLPLPNLTPEMASLHREMMENMVDVLELEISIELPNSTWLNVATLFESPPWQNITVPFISFLISAVLVIGTLFWFAIFRLTRPLMALTTASNEFGRGETVDQLSAVGPSELRALTHAFNTMQNRIRNFISDRTMVLAALAHDLRSPLTALRIQAENISDKEIQISIRRSVKEMSDMIDATLEYSEGLDFKEEFSHISIVEILENLPISYACSYSNLIINVRPKALVRALRNLIENAKRYGNQADIRLAVKEPDLYIYIDDTGPGIPEKYIERVFEPFFRLEKSRSRNTGGVGLGLAIARTIILAHGGTIALKNKETGGLQVVISLPRSILKHKEEV